MVARQRSAAAPTLGQPKNAWTHEAQQSDVEAALATLRAQGSRITTARVAILQVLDASEGHLSADDVAHAVNAVHPAVHRATIYRTLDSLVSCGLVAHTHLGHGTAVYHLTTEPHAHCQCQRCDAVIDVPSDLLRTVARHLSSDYGFTLDAGHSALLGLCATCAAAEYREEPITRTHN